MRWRPVPIAAALAAALHAPGQAAAPPRPPLRCGVDEGRDRVCGPRPGSLYGRPASACPAGPATLDLRMSEPAVYSEARPDEELVRLGFPGWVFESERQREYPRDQARGGFRPPGPGIPLVECCYVACAPIPVAGEGRAEGIPTGFCMDPPEGGTRFPAPGAPACPRAVKVAGVFRAFTGRGPSGRCCYAVPLPPPPGAP